MPLVFKNVKRYSRIRWQTGSILLLSVLCAFVIFLVGLWLFTEYQSFLLEHQRTQYAAQAAAMTAARELSNIVAADPYSGFVSVSDHPACGIGTMAPDGEPLPITGINTITATVRMEKLLAQKLKDDTLAELAEDDYQKYIGLKKRLQSVLDKAVLPVCKMPLKDLNGNPVKIYKAAYESFIQNMPELYSGKATVKNFSLSLGWVEDGSTTVTLDCQRKAPIAGEPVNNDASYYKSCVDIPVGKDSFYFAGVADQVRLVEAERFRQGDGQHLSTCVEVSAEIEMSSKGQNIGDQASVFSSVPVTAVALPYCERNCAVPGTFAVSLPQGNAAKISNLLDLIQLPEMTGAQAIHAVASGDFPVDQNSTLLEDWSCSHSMSYYVGRSVFDWLRTANARARFDSVVAALNYPFQSSTDLSQANLVITYIVDSAGEVQVNSMKEAGFMIRIIADKQSKDAAQNLMTNSTGILNIHIRNEVADQGVSTDTLSKHGGQPITTELPYLISQFSEIEEQNQLELSAEARARLRQSYRKGGLAVALELYYTY